MTAVVDVVAQPLHTLVTALRARGRARPVESRFRGAFEEAPIGMAIVSIDGRISDANGALRRICGRGPDELTRLSLRELVVAEDAGQLEAAIEALRADVAARLSLDLRIRRVDGVAIDVIAHGAVLSDPDGSPVEMLWHVDDLSERKLYEQRLQFMADHDPLTGLPNRRRFEDELNHHVAHVARYGPDGALIVLDIDHFKQINDTMGNNAGDELIVAVADVLRSRLRESDVLARLGGDEFAVLLPRADAAQAERVAAALVEAVRASSARVDGRVKHLSISVGVSLFDAEPDRLTGDGLLAAADLAMYDAKEAGRDRYAVYSRSTVAVSRTEERLVWANRIEAALERERLTLVAQPIVDLRSGRISQYELLVRMLDESDQLIEPSRFLSSAERYGLISRIDRWVIRRAVGLLRHHPDLLFSVNISGRSLGDDALLEEIDRCLAGGGVDPGNLIFEVTETAAVANLAQAQRFARHLRELGCRLDD
jgi:diguanylate cyclase (GGDEF)-like protein/PAS domain S-box-containing protein